VVTEPIGGIIDDLTRRYRKNNIEQMLLDATTKLEADPNEALDFLINQSHQILISSKDKSRSYSYIGNTDARIEDYYRRASEEQKITGCPTGWRLFDEHTLGLQRGELAVLFAGTGVGKSYLLCRLALGAYTLGWNPLVIAYEPTIPSMWRRLDSIVSRINPKRYRMGELEPEELQQYLDRMELLKQHDRPFMIVKPINNSVAGIVETLNEYRYDRDENWVVFIDQMSFMKSQGEKHEFYRNLFLEITKTISETHLNVPCWLLAQENREGMKASEARLYHIALTSFAEQFSDMVLNLYRGGESAVLKLLKFREGFPADFTMHLEISRGIIEVGGMVSENL